MPLPCAPALTGCGWCGAGWAASVAATTVPSTPPPSPPPALVTKALLTRPHPHPIYTPHPPSRLAPASAPADEDADGKLFDEVDKTEEIGNAVIGRYMNTTGASRSQPFFPSSPATGPAPFSEEGDRAFQGSSGGNPFDTAVDAHQVEELCRVVASFATMVFRSRVAAVASGEEEGSQSGGGDGTGFDGDGAAGVDDGGLPTDDRVFVDGSRGTDRPQQRVTITTRSFLSMLTTFLSLLRRKVATIHRTATRALDARRFLQVGIGWCVVEGGVSSRVVYGVVWCRGRGGMGWDGVVEGGGVVWGSIACSCGCGGRLPDHETGTCSLPAPTRLLSTGRCAQRC